MKKHLLPLILILTSLSLVSCGGKKGMVKKLEPDDLYARGQQSFANKKYVDAMEDFRDIIFNYAGSKISLDATYYLAECYLRTKDYPSAVAEFQHILNEYSPCRYDDDSRFKIAYCYYKDSPNYALDQTETTVKAKQAIEQYFAKLQDSTLVNDAQRLQLEINDKLAHKEYDAGRIYFKMKRWGSARLYLENLKRDYPSTVWAGEADKLLSQMPPAPPSLQPAAQDSLPPAAKDSTGN
jgi:outer membrane protein assembly factor BamD